jgi:hypothetical protein
MRELSWHQMVKDHRSGNPPGRENYPARWGCKGIFCPKKGRVPTQRQDNHEWTWIETGWMKFEKFALNRKEHNPSRN